MAEKGIWQVVSGRFLLFFLFLYQKEDLTKRLKTGEELRGHNKQSVN